MLNYLAFFFSPHINSKCTNVIGFHPSVQCFDPLLRTGDEERDRDKGFRDDSHLGRLFGKTNTDGVRLC